MSDLEITWNRGTAKIQLLGGMVAPVDFWSEDHRIISPLVVAPWLDDQDNMAYHELPGLMRGLRGEWPCIPFGSPAPDLDLPHRWARLQNTNLEHALGDDFHGFASHNTWHVTGQTVDSVELTIDYPESHDVQRLVRRLYGVKDQMALKFELSISVRRPCALPIALHPIFRLPVQINAADLETGPFEQGFVFPKPVETGVSRLVPDSSFVNLQAVPAETGPVSLAQFPLPYATEELVQLCGTKGCISLHNHAESYTATLRFDPEVFPSTVLWISNGGRRAYPWNGRFIAIGIEPVCSAFDLGPHVSNNPQNPIAQEGYATSVELSPEYPFTTCYQLSVSALDEVA